MSVFHTTAAALCQTHDVRMSDKIISFSLSPLHKERERERRGERQTSVSYLPRTNGFIFKSRAEHVALKMKNENLPKQR